MRNDHQFLIIINYTDDHNGFIMVIGESWVYTEYADEERWVQSQEKKIPKGFIPTLKAFSLIFISIFYSRFYSFSEWEWRY